jgi:predicted metal-dependent hydrolase
MGWVSQKKCRVSALVEPFHGKQRDARYLAFFDCFNRGLFFEAHEVLEELWLADRHGLDGAFYKGLIQVAGGFVHLQKRRPRPAAALFELAGRNLASYPATHHGLGLIVLRSELQIWSDVLRLTEDPLAVSRFELSIAPET